MFCQKCGKEIKGDVPNFCPSCGEKISNQIEGKDPMYNTENNPRQSLEKKVWYRVLKIFYIFSYVYLLTLGFVTLYDDISSNLEDSQIAQIEQKLPIREFRAKYPEYNDLSDKELADSLYSKGYDAQKINAARSEGYSDGEIINFLEKKFAPKPMSMGEAALITTTSYGLPDGFVLDEQHYQGQPKSKMKPWERFGDKKRQEWSVTKVFVKPFLQFLQTLVIGFLAIELVRAVLRYVILNQKPDNIIFRYVVNFPKKIR